jgi:hypothetical protein
MGEGRYDTSKLDENFMVLGLLPQHQGQHGAVNLGCLVIEPQTASAAGSEAND